MCAVAAGERKVGSGGVYWTHSTPLEDTSTPLIVSSTLSVAAVASGESHETAEPPPSTVAGTRMRPKRQPRSRCAPSPRLRLSPVKLTRVPPAFGPACGETLFGKTVARYRKGVVTALNWTPLRETLTFTSPSACGGE